MYYQFMFLFSVLLVMGTLSFAYAETPVKTISENNTIIKNTGLLMDSSLVNTKIILLDTGQPSIENKTYDVEITNFVATSKGHASFAPNELKKDVNVKVISTEEFAKNKSAISSITKMNEITISNNIEEFYVVADLQNFDIATYSGKIMLKNTEDAVEIPIVIKVKHNLWELMLFALIGVMVGIIIAIWITRVKPDSLPTGRIKNAIGKITWQSKPYFKITENKPMISTALIAGVGFPSSIIVGKEFVGSILFDLVVAVAMGAIVVTKLLEKNE